MIPAGVLLLLSRDLVLVSVAVIGTAGMGIRNEPRILILVQLNLAGLLAILVHIKKRTQSALR